MKKVILGLLVLAILLGGALAQAQEKKVSLSLNLGMQTNLERGTSFDLSQGSVDFRAGIRLGKSFQISPELMYVTSDKLHTDYGYIYPGIMLNYQAKNFFVGAGVVLPVVYGGGETNAGNPALKLNVGYIVKNIMLTAYIIMWDENYDYFNFIGATVGYRF